MSRISAMALSNPFEHSLVVRWVDVDALGHMANTAYLNACVDTRFAYFTSRGLSAGEIRQLGVGPVVRRDEVDYYRELRFGDSYRIDFALAGLAADASRMRLRNRFYRADGELAAQVVSFGGWLDFATRKLVAPPEALREALHALARTEEFEVLPSTVDRK